MNNLTINSKQTELKELLETISLNPETYFSVTDLNDLSINNYIDKYNFKNYINGVRINCLVGENDIEILCYDFTTSNSKYLNSILMFQESKKGPQKKLTEVIDIFKKNPDFKTKGLIILDKPLNYNLKEIEYMLNAGIDGINISFNYTNKEIEECYKIANQFHLIVLDQTLEQSQNEFIKIISKRNKSI